MANDFEEVFAKFPVCYLVAVKLKTHKKRLSNSRRF